MSLSIVLYEGIYSQTDTENTLNQKATNTLKYGVQAELCDCNEAAIEATKMSPISLLNTRMSNSYTLSICLVYNNNIAKLVKKISECKSPYFYYATILSKGLPILTGTAHTTSQPLDNKTINLEISGEEYDFMGMFEGKTFCELIPMHFSEIPGSNTYFSYTPTFRNIAGQKNGDSGWLITFSNVWHNDNGITNYKMAFFLKEHLKRAFAAVGYQLEYSGSMANTEEIRDLVILYNKGKIKSDLQNVAIAGKWSETFDNEIALSSPINGKQLSLGPPDNSTTYNSILGVYPDIFGNPPLPGDYTDYTQNADWSNYPSTSLNLLHIPSCGSWEIKIYVTFTFWVLLGSVTREEANILGQPNSQFPEQRTVTKLITVTDEFCCGTMAAYLGYYMPGKPYIATPDDTSWFSEAWASVKDWFGGESGEQIVYFTKEPFISLYFLGEKYPIFNHFEYYNNDPYITGIFYCASDDPASFTTDYFDNLTPPTVRVYFSAKSQDSQGVCFENDTVDLTTPGNCLDIPITNIIEYFTNYRNFSFIKDSGGANVVRMIHNSELIKTNPYQLAQYTDKNGNLECNTCIQTRFSQFQQSPQYYGYEIPEDDTFISKYHEEHPTEIFAEAIHIVKNIRQTEYPLIFAPSNPQPLVKLVKRTYTNTPNTFEPAYTKAMTYYNAPETSPLAEAEIFIATIGLEFDKESNYRILLHLPNNIETPNGSPGLPFPKLIFWKQDFTYSLCFDDEFGEGILTREFKEAFAMLDCTTTLECSLLISDYEFYKLDMRRPYRLYINGRYGLFLIKEVKKKFAANGNSLSTATLVEIL